MTSRHQIRRNRRRKGGAAPLPTCVNASGNRNSSGYPRVWVGSKRVLAHRNAWLKANGEIAPGLCVLHTCDNRACVNVAHLYLGTRKDNTRDMLTRGRQGFRVVLDADKARAIREGFRAGRRVSDLAREFGVNTGTVTCVVKGRTWNV